MLHCIIMTESKKIIRDTAQLPIDKTITYKQIYGKKIKE